MTEDWVKVYGTEESYKAELIKAALEDQAKVKCFVLNKSDSMHTHLSIGEIEVYVAKEDVINAKYFISKNEL